MASERDGRGSGCAAIHASIVGLREMPRPIAAETSPPRLSAPSSQVHSRSASIAIAMTTKGKAAGRSRQWCRPARRSPLRHPRLEQALDLPFPTFYIARVAVAIGSLSFEHLPRRDRPGHAKREREITLKRFMGLRLMTAQRECRDEAGMRLRGIGISFLRFACVGGRRCRRAAPARLHSTAEPAGRPRRCDGRT